MDTWVPVETEVVSQHVGFEMTVLRREDILDGLVSPAVTSQRIRVLSKTF